MLAYVLALAVGLGSLAIYLAAFFFPEIHRKGDFIWSGVGLFYALVLWVCAERITGGLLLGQVAGVALLGWSVTQTLQLRRELTPSQQQTELPSAEEVKNTVDDKISNLSIQQRLSQLGDRLSGSVTGVKDQIQQRLSGSTQRQSQSAAAPSTQPPSTPSTSAPSAVSPAPALEQDEIQQKVQIVDKRTPIPEQPADIAAAEIEPAVTEEEAIAQAVETTLAEDVTPKASQGEQEGASELVRPNPPDPELVETAIRDAEEKEASASPPDIAPKNP